MRRSLSIILGIAALGAIAWSVLFAIAVRPPAPLRAPAAGFRLSDVHLIEPGNGRRRSVSVRIEGDQVVAIDPASDAPVEAGVASRASGLESTFVLPGLTDVHLHFPQTGFPGDPEYTALLLLYHGVTAARLLGGSEIAERDALRSRIDSGAMPGPYFQSCGPFIDGPSPVLPGAWVVRNADEARAAVRRLADQGADCVKAYDRLDRESVMALREAAVSHGIRIVGHTPQSVGLEDARLQDVQHLRGFHPPFEDEGRDYPQLMGPWLRMDDARREETAEIALRHEMAVTPTLSAVEATLAARDWERWRETRAMRAWFPHLRDGFWSADVGLNPVRMMRPDEFQLVERALAEMKQTVLWLNEAGIPIHTGTDANAPNLVPGASLHRELELLVEAGLTPEEALTASTMTSPRALGLESAGRLRVGSPANLAIFREDPTQDIAALESLVAVVQDGRLYTRADLDARIERYATHYRGAGFRYIVMPTLRGGMRIVTGLLMTLGRNGTGEPTPD